MILLAAVCQYHMPETKLLKSHIRLAREGKWLLFYGIVFNHTHAESFVT